MRPRLPPGMEKYRTESTPKPDYRKRLIDQVNAEVPVGEVLRALYDVRVPEGDTPWRTHCPWRTEHSDGGVAKTLRVFPQTNTAYCFATHGSLSPVGLWVETYGGTWYMAARAMAKKYGVGERHEHYVDRMVRLVEEFNDEGDDDILNVPYILQAILPTHPNYVEYQFDRDVQHYVVEWSEQEFEAKDMEKFNKWKAGLWALLDEKSGTDSRNT